MIIHPKLYDRPDSEISYRVRRVNENKWFEQNQRMLLWILNTNEGKDFFRVTPYLRDRPIIEISKRHIKFYNGLQNNRHSFTSEFRGGAKYANIIRFKWEEFLRLANSYEFYNNVPDFQRLAPSKIRGTVTTVYPDPHTESTTVDGECARISVNETWASKRSGSGNSAGDTLTAGACGIRCSSTTNQWLHFWRDPYLFDTSSIDDTDTVDSAVCSFYTQNSRSTTLGTFNTSLVDSTPASNTALVNGDYNQVNTTKQATDILLNTSSEVYNDYTLNATGLTSISLTGVTKFGLRIANDVDDSEPTWGSNQQYYQYCYHADQTGTANDPKLAVTHSASSSFTPKMMMF